MNTSLKSELKRKALHLTGLVVPALYILTDREFTLTFVATAFAVFVVLEPFRIIEELRDRIKLKLRLINPDVVTGIEVLERHVMDIEREHERLGVAAHIYFALASLIVVYFFTENVAIAAVTVATLGDAMAAIIGKNFGRHRFSNGKSLEGSLAYFLSALLVIYPLLGLKLAIAGALIGTLVEFYGLPPDDNFSNQVCVAFALYLFSLI
ncbi:diacylglycerol/polyprenol kinase family protein [Thermococcus gammatolerans]|uniref:Phosphatidate cytidylyltransferase (CdsA) n=1 Tax=Thermococcus gammatolerans (strain DSM 15229 / JCM 11827 / EJ3) TaxID=593117 RepID=C5A2X4_THEGJ|nr:diacylglycerol/polyprenol kinase family protein [Thermococcus gammatolerans]ACS34635.1 Phosphatidate cytidylyltransferase (cdsA) [Thermococcus gammatolerans EJ3]